MAAPTKPTKPQSVPYRFIRPDGDLGQRMYTLLHELVDAHHQEVCDARFALAFQTSWKPDADGHVTLGECKKVSELEREVHELVSYDFVIIVRQEFWEDPQVTEHQRRALLDHELYHAAVKLDEHGDPLVNERGRTVYRVRKHDLEEFAAIADRYGCWKRDLEMFAGVLDRARARSREWIGYTRLRETLLTANVDIPLDTILTWTDHERREAEVWALLEHAVLARRHGAAESSLGTVCPAHVTAALPTRERCDHKFIGSNCCLKCGWVPTPADMAAAGVDHERGLIS